MPSDRSRVNWNRDGIRLEKAVLNRNNVSLIWTSNLLLVRRSIEKAKQRLTRVLVQEVVVDSDDHVHEAIVTFIGQADVTLRTPRVKATPVRCNVSTRCIQLRD